MNRQLPLGLQLKASARFDSFVSGPNQELIEQLRTLSGNPVASFVAYWGARGAGKTHLLHACCHRAAGKNYPVACLDFLDCNELPPQLLDSWEQYSLICLDNVQAIAGNDAWEEALFHLYNRIREQQGSLVISADCAPAQLPINLPDLRTRLGWGLTYQLQNLDDEQRLQVLRLRAQQRGCEMPEETGRYLMKRISRDLPDLVSLIDQLDEASLAEQRRLTVPFVKQVLSL